MPSSIMSSGSQRQQWSVERVIEAIQARYRSSLPVNAQAVQSDDSRLLAAGRRLFGSWSAALVAAQVPIPRRRGYSRHPRGFWTRDRISGGDPEALPDRDRDSSAPQPLHARRAGV